MFRVYSFSFNNPQRQADMNQRFSQIDIPIQWIDPVLSSDSRIPSSVSNPRMHSIMLTHLDMIHAFLQSDAEYGIFTEDDIFIRRSFRHDITVAIDAYKRLPISVLLLGYLSNYRVANTHIHKYHTAIETPFVFTNVPHDLWGSQMYMMNRLHATACLDIFRDYSLVSTHFSPDWTITKMPGASCIYPMLAVEAGAVQTDHYGQIQFHKKCFETNFDSALYF